jgi:spermidine synthase
MRSIPLRLRIAVLCSGASALSFEVLWTRALARHFGSTAPAVTTVVATFMAGMTLGALIFGPLADRSPQPLRLYRRIELAIAISALGLSLILLRGSVVLTGLARLTEAAGPLSGIARCAAFALLLLGPSTLLGATLIVLARAILSQGQTGRALGSLYALNVAGAVLGTLLPDFVLIPRLGLTATAAAASCGNLLAALLASGLAAASPPAPQPEFGHSKLDLRAGLALALYALNGCCAMAAEVLWSRTLEHWAAALVTSFAVLLAVYLGCVALGSWLMQRWADRLQDPLAWATLTVSLLAPAVLLPLAGAGAWRDLQRVWLPRPEGVLRPSLWYEALNALLHALYLESTACLLMGATFPLLAAASVRGGHSGRQLGALYAANTAAGVLGSLLVGFVWLPALGELYAYFGIAFLAAVGGGALAFFQAARAPRWGALTALVVSTVCLWLLPPDLLQRAHFRSGGHLIALEEGATTSAAAAQRFRFGMPSHLELMTPGVSMSDTSFGARRYMGMMAQLAAFFSERPARALLVCYGVGNTADALLSHPDLERLDVVDLSPEVLALSPVFAATRTRSAPRVSDPLRDPRTHVFVDDGRHHLLVRPLTYDIITSEPPPPNHAGVVNLYSREYYQIAKQRLRPGGVLTQWLPVFQLSAHDNLAIIAAFSAELPYSALFYGYEQQWILVGSSKPLRIDLAHWQARAALPPVAANLLELGTSESELYGSELRALVRDVTPLRDDTPSIEYPTQAVRSAWQPARPPRRVPRALTLLGDSPLDPAARASLERASAATDAMFEALPRRMFAPLELWEAGYATPLLDRVGRGKAGEAVLALLGADNETARLAESALAADPTWRSKLTAHNAPSGRARNALEDALTTLARRALYLDQPARTQQLLTVLPDNTHTPQQDLLLGLAERRLGHSENAKQHLEHARNRSSSPAFAHEIQQLLASTSAIDTATEAR